MITFVFPNPKFTKNLSSIKRWMWIIKIKGLIWIISSKITNDKVANFVFNLDHFCFIPCLNSVLTIILITLELLSKNLPLDFLHIFMSTFSSLNPNIKQTLSFLFWQRGFYLTYWWNWDSSHTNVCFEKEFHLKGS